MLPVNLDNIILFPVVPTSLETTARTGRRLPASPSHAAGTHPVATLTLQRLPKVIFCDSLLNFFGLAVILLIDAPLLCSLLNPNKLIGSNGSGGAEAWSSSEARYGSYETRYAPQYQPPPPGAPYPDRYAPPPREYPRKY